MRHLRRHADALAQRGMRVDGFADVHGVCTHLDGQRNLADHAPAQDIAVAVRLGGIVKRQFDHTFVAAIGDSAA